LDEIGKSPKKVSALICRSVLLFSDKQSQYSVFFNFKIFSPGGGHPSPDQGEQLGPGPEGRPDLGRGSQQQRPARHLSEGPGRMERRVRVPHL